MGSHCPMIREDIIKYINENKEAIEKTIDYERDYLFDYFGFKTLENHIC